MLNHLFHKQGGTLGYLAPCPHFTNGKTSPSEGMYVGTCPQLLGAKLDLNTGLSPPPLIK